jgi:hypothetical protein
MESKKINQLATELAPDLSDLTIIGDPTTGISKKITLSQMASLFTGTVEEYANFAAFPLVGVADTIYVAKDTNVIYRWDSTAYVVLSPNIIASLVFNDANGFDGTISLVGSVATLTITTALTTGSIGFIGASGALLQDNANFFWDDTNNRLGLGTNAPTTALDVFGSGIIGRINGTSTNNAYLGFSSAGTNKWSVGNVQSDHRFRIFSEANSAELVSVLQTGEFGIGIANPLTKLHIDGGATALIANLDANVSVAKSLSFRSDNSNRINLEVSGTESGSNAGMDLFIRAYSDAGALLNTPFTIKRSTGNIGIFTNTPNAILDIAVDAATYNYPRIYDSRTQAIDRGAKLSLGGYSDSLTTITAFAQLLSGKTNATSGNTSGYLAFLTNNGTSLTEKLRITDTGNVGIGNPAPDGKLHVFGKTYARYGQDDMFAFYYDDNYRFGITNPSTDLRQLRVFGQAADGNSFIVFATGNNTERGRFSSTGQFVTNYGQTGGYVRVDSGYVNETLAVTNNCISYFFYKYSGGGGGSSTTYFNITGISTTNGTWFDVVLRARKDATGSAINTGAYLQINGATIDNITAGGTGAVQIDKRLRIVRMSDEWLILSTYTV